MSILLSKLLSQRAIGITTAVRKAGRDPLTGEIIGAAIEVHRNLGPGLLESAYRECLRWELWHRGFGVDCERPLPVFYKGTHVDVGYRIDLVVEERVLVETKSVARLAPIHTAQVITYLKLSRLPIALLINFNVRVLIDGVVRLAV
jgi:GxxExxY protein